MLRKFGFTPEQLRKAYEEASQKPHGEVDFVQLFGKPPYEFLGDAGDRDYPNYTDFSVQYVDDIGRQYQATDDENRFFVRIPIAKTRQSNAGTYEDRVGFPEVGDTLNLSGVTDELHVRVQDTPYDQKRAVSNIYVEVVSKTTFIPDLIDAKGRMFMRCVRSDDKCVLGISFEKLDDTALYYVRLPPACLCNQDSITTTGFLTPQMISSIYTQATEPYVHHQQQRRMLNSELTRISDFLATRFVSLDINERFPARGERFLAYHMYGQKYIEFRVKSSTEVENHQHSPKSSCFVMLHARKIHQVSLTAAPNAPPTPKTLSNDVYKPATKYRRTDGSPDHVSYSFSESASEMDETKRAERTRALAEEFLHKQ